MAKGKLILICQSGGEFVKSDDGSLQYDGGEAQAVNVNRDTLFDDLKLKLAETCNLEYKSVSIKYFLPGNSRTLITLANAKDLKRMLDFHGNSVTADIFVLGRQGFICNALDAHTIRETGIKVAESVNRVVAPTAAATSSPNAAANPVCTPARVAGMRTGSQKKAARVAIGKTASQKKSTRVATARTASQKKATRVATGKIASQKKTAGATKSSPLSETVCALNIAAHEDSDYFSAALSSPDSFAAKATSHSSTEVDLDATPADSVKKRRRTASWKIGMNSPTVVVVPDAGDKIPRKKVNRRLVGEGYMKKSKEIVPRNDGFGTSSHFTVSDDVSAEQLVASWKDGITGIGQDFMDVSEFRDVLQKYAIAHRFAYRLKKNETNRASGRCVAEGCSWRIHASWVPSAQSFTIRKFNNTHTCGGESWKSAHPPKNWLVNIIKDKLRDSPNHKPKEIADGISRDFGIELNYTQLWRGIGDARKQLQGSYREAYNQLSWYCEKITETNPGSYAKLDIGDDKRFRCLFVSFHASIQGFLKGCRPLLFLESTSLKSKRQEVLLTATALDGDDGFFPVAFAIVDVDTDDNWYWFLGHLRSALPTSDPITFVSDREKGLKESVLKAFGNAYNGYSMYHLLESFKKSLKGPFHGDGRGSLPVNFVAAAHAVRPLGFKKFTEQIKHVSPQAYDWVMQVEPENWASTSFKGERYNHITQNVGELYIKLMEEAREVPITQKIEALISMMINLTSTRQADSSNWSTELTPSKNEKLQEEIFDACGLKVLFSSDTLFEVHQDVNHVVNLEKCECTCLGWQTSGLPCCHAIAVFNSARRCLYDHCSKYFTVDSYRLTYAEPINPVPSAGKAEENEVSDSDTTEHVLPPCPSRLLSQLKPKQAKRPGETKRVVICSRCKEAGHNKASCKATL